MDAGAKDLAQLVKTQANVGFGLARRRSLRSVWLDEFPAVGAALAVGTLGTAQVDELCALADRLAPEQRDTLRDAIPSLIAEVAPLTPPRTRRHLADFEASLDTDGRQRLERQRRTAELRLTKNSDDTVGIHGNLDPVAGARVRRAIDDKVAELWRREGKGRAGAAVPTTVLSSGAWRARALADLVSAGASGAGGVGASLYEELIPNASVQQAPVGLRYYWEADLAAGVALTGGEDYWISVYRFGGSIAFLWTTNPDSGDGRRATSVFPTSQDDYHVTDGTFDMAWQLIPTPGAASMLLIAAGAAAARRRR